MLMKYLHYAYLVRWGCQMGGGGRLGQHLLLLTSLLRLPGQLQQLRGGRGGVEAGPEQGRGGRAQAGGGQRAGTEVLGEHDEPCVRWWCDNNHWRCDEVMITSCLTSLQRITDWGLQPGSPHISQLPSDTPAAGANTGERPAAISTIGRHHLMEHLLSISMAIVYLPVALFTKCPAHQNCGLLSI